MNKNWTISNGTLYRANHNGTAKGYMVGNVKHLTESQLAEILKAANEEKTIKEKVATAKKFIQPTPMSGPELQSIRKEIQGIAWFADKLGVSQSTLESYECGRLPIPAERVRRAKEIAEKAKAI